MLAVVTQDPEAFKGPQKPEFINTLEGFCHAADRYSQVSWLIHE